MLKLQAERSHKEILGKPRELMQLKQMLQLMQQAAQNCCCINYSQT
jgi:hypothetical protein